MHLSAEIQLAAHCIPQLQPGMVVLEVGPDAEGIVRKMILARGCEYTWCDIVTPPALSPTGFDAIVCTNVIEHVERPWRFVPWMAGMLAPGGLLMLQVPNTWPYHESLTLDYFRAWAPGLRVLIQDAGLEWVEGASEPGPQAQIDTYGIGRRA